jgi:hypothetical protein
MLMADSRDLALIDLRDIRVAYRLTRFVETDQLPSDATVADQTWAKVNKDGSPDRRFANNFRIPVAGYGGLTIQTDNGINEEYQFSNAEKAEAFAEAFADYQTKLRMLGDRAPEDARKALPEKTDKPPAASEPAKVPEFTQKAGAFLQVAQAASLAHMGRLVEEFHNLFVADIKSFDGGRSMKDIGRFVNYVAGVPGQLQAFLARVPDASNPKMKEVTGTFVKSVRDMGHGVAVQLRTGIEKLDAEQLAAPETVQALKTVREAEAVLRK